MIEYFNAYLFDIEEHGGEEASADGDRPVHRVEPRGHKELAVRDEEGAEVEGG
jgi:hypothetical protein